ncbi:MAG: hypothetical protein U0797_18500 [Gemmataceae bacterium]
MALPKTLTVALLTVVVAPNRLALSVTKMAVPEPPPALTLPELVRVLSRITTGAAPVRRTQTPASVLELVMVLPMTWVATVVADVPPRRTTAAPLVERPPLLCVKELLETRLLLPLALIWTPR